jgi:hypothetical protein
MEHLVDDSFTEGAVQRSPGDEPAVEHRPSEAVEQLIEVGILAELTTSLGPCEYGEDRYDTVALMARPPSRPRGTRALRRVGAAPDAMRGGWIFQS